MVETEPWDEAPQKWIYHGWPVDAVALVGLLALLLIVFQYTSAPILDSTLNRRWHRMGEYLEFLTELGWRAGDLLLLGLILATFSIILVLDLITGRFGLFLREVVAMLLLGLAYLLLPMWLDRDTTGLYRSFSLTRQSAPTLTHLFAWSNHRARIIPIERDDGHWYGGYIGLSLALLIPGRIPSPPGWPTGRLLQDDRWFYRNGNTRGTTSY